MRSLRLLENRLTCLQELQLSRSYWGQRPLPHSAHKTALSELFSLGQIYRGVYDRLSETQHKQVMEYSAEVGVPVQEVGDD